MTHYGTTDFNNENYSYSDDNSSVSTDENQYRKVLQNMKKLDPAYFTVKRNKFSEKYEKMKPTKIELYRTSRAPNQQIRNAVTGIRENLKVGKFESDLLFKVILATGETGANPEHLYFDSPEQYEKHFNVTVPINDKKIWQKKYNYEFNKRFN